MLDLQWQKKAAEAVSRDPRQFPFGVLTGGSFVLDSSRVFLWFETLNDLADHLNDTEPRVRNLEPSDGLEEYQAEIAPLLARLPLEGLTEALREDLKPIIDDMFVIDWWGTFDDLRNGSGKVAEDVRSMFSGDDDASALPDNADLDEFVEFLLRARSEGRWPMVAGLRKGALAFLLLTAVAACAPSSNIPAAEKLVAARLGDPPGVTFPGGPIEAPLAVCGLVNSGGGVGTSGEERFVVRLDPGANGNTTLGEVSIDSPSSPKGTDEHGKPESLFDIEWNVWCAKALGMGSPDTIKAPDAVKAKASWNYSDESDALHDAKTHLACTTSTNNAVLSAPYSSVTAELCVRRKPSGKLDAFVRLDGEGQILCGIEECSTPIRFDKGKIVHFPSVGAADHSSNIIFLNSTGHLVAALKHSSKTVIELQFYQNGSQDLEFETAGLNW